MAAVVNFDYNGTPVTVTTPAQSLIFYKVPAFPGQTVLYNYIMLVAFLVGTDQQFLEIRLFTDTIAVTTYQLSNQGTLTDYSAIVLSNSMYMRCLKGNNPYNSRDAAKVRVSAVSSAPEADGTFDGELDFFTTAPVINNTLPMLSPPSAPAATISITNGSFSGVPIQV